MQHLLAGFLAPYVLATACFALISHRRAATFAKVGVLLGGCLLIVLSPLLIPVEQPLPRFLAAMSATLTAIKVLDAWLDQRRMSPPTWKQFVAFLVNPFVLVRRCLPLERQVPGHENLLRLVLGSVGCAIGVTILTRLFSVDWQDLPFLLEHASKVTALMMTIIFALSASIALWRLSGGTGREYMHSPFAARTPADFWRRYNRNMQQFFWEDIFKPLGGHRTPIRTTLLIFGLSALIHELLFYAAIGRMQGYQLVFFALHGIAAAMTLRVRAKKGWAAIPWIVSTLAFNLASSVFFFASINEVTPFYSRRLPDWLQGW
ncbi:membrane bound O-acyl transferase family-domain-containing protein [Acidovorax sp. LjRoot129]|uniref:MBOAT family O-acyltransferase n=1 Tax=Acidovorax sp. LjRoot129 TaxID=3342260 RepID=UPI003ECF0DA3